jgi:hypothetical protein
MMSMREGGPAQVKGGRGSHASILMALLGLMACVGATMSTRAGAETPTCPNATFRAGVSASLPDCRAYEQVSPTEKGGFAAYPTQVLPAQVSEGGEGQSKLAYLGYQAFPGSVGNTALFAAHLGTRTASGWQDTELTPAVPHATALKIYEVSYAFSEDLTQSVMRVPFVPLTSEATPGVYNLFLRHPDGHYSSVNAAPPAVSPEAFCEAEGYELSSCFEIADISTFAGASGDFGHVLFESTSQLTPEAPETGTSSLYENDGGLVRLVGILPDGSPAARSTAGAGSSVNYAGAGQATDRRVEHAISRDGSHVVFQAPADGGQPDPAQNGNTEVYDRIDGKETIELSAPAEGATPKVSTPAPATFWEASQDGSRVFFTSAAELTTPSRTNAEAEDEDLYEYNVGTRTLTDLSVDTNPADASTGAMVQGVVDISHDGSYVYFVAKGQLVEGKGVDGQPNLYVVHNGGKPVFIATLNSSGSCSFNEDESADSCDWTSRPPQLEAYVTPDGRHMAFMSTMSIPTLNFPSGYDNTDQKTAEPDSEVYEYTAPTAGEEEGEGGGQLICASCKANGEQPQGNALIGGINLTEEAASKTQPYRGISTPFYRARPLSDNGARLFYSAPQPLAGAADRIYEYEQSGEGSCASAVGCQSLISSPGGGETDQFLGASASGDDVYLATSSRLSAFDQDNVRDVYDARVGGGIATPPTEVRCENDCRQPGSSTTGIPALQSGSNGPSGNLSPPPMTSSKPLTRAQKLARALKVCHSKRNRHKRASCEASARHRFGPKAKAKRSDLKRRAK